MAVVVRQIRQADLAGYHAALDAVTRERRYLLALQAPPLEQLRARVDDAVERDLPLYVAECDACIVAWAEFAVADQESTRHSARLTMGVLRDYRHQGIGSELLDAVIAHAWRCGLKRLELEVFSNNSVAIAMYRRRGFALEGTKRAARCIDGRYYDVEVMAHVRT